MAERNKKKPLTTEEIAKNIERHLKEKGEKDVTKEDFDALLKAVSKKKK